MKILILADGDGTRWGNYLGVPKQYITIDGETILDRMIRLVYQTEKDITIIGSFKHPHAKNDHFDDRLKRHLFQHIAERYREPFIMLNGDCYYTEGIIKDCLTRETDRWLHWCCPHRNEYTGKPYGEGYIHKVVDIDWWIRKLSEFNQLVDSGKIQIGNDWSINRFLYGWSDLKTHYTDPSHLSEYDVYWYDETDDFDYPRDYDNFIRKTRRI